MGLSHEKMVHLSHVVTNALDGDDAVTFLKPHNQVRLEVVEALRRESAQEDEIEHRARNKILSMKKDIAWCAGAVEQKVQAWEIQGAIRERIQN